MQEVYASCFEALAMFCFIVLFKPCHAFGISNTGGLQGRSLLDLETLEKDLRRSLDGVCKERDRILKEQITKDEQRLCVVCQVKHRNEIWNAFALKVG